MSRYTIIPRLVWRMMDGSRRSSPDSTSYEIVFTGGSPDAPNEVMATCKAEGNAMRIKNALESTYETHEGEIEKLKAALDNMTRNAIALEGFKEDCDRAATSRPKWMGIAHHVGQLEARYKEFAAEIERLKCTPPSNDWVTLTYHAETVKQYSSTVAHKEACIVELEARLRTYTGSPIPHERGYSFDPPRPFINWIPHDERARLKRAEAERDEAIKDRDHCRAQANEMRDLLNRQSVTIAAIQKALEGT